MKNPILSALLNTAPAGTLEYMMGDPKRMFPWGGPMNGQTARLAIAKAIIESGCSEVIETGTFRGTTTEWFAGLGTKVVSIEHSPRYHAFASMRVRKFPNVSLILGESTAVLKTLTGSPGVFFYLDAHWENYLPLAEELRLAFAKWPDCIVMVDDFQVPGDAGYTYDDYGAGEALTVEYVERVGIPGLRMFFPSTPSAEETGARRGCTVIAIDPMKVEMLSKLSLLRAHSP